MNITTAKMKSESIFDLSFDLENQNFVENSNFQCESCDASFDEEYLLKKHVLNNHEGNT